MKPNEIVLNNFLIYLRMNGWEQIKKFENPNVLLFSRIISNSNSLSLVLPAKESFADYQQRIYSALTLLSSIENRNKELIVKDINECGSDSDKLEIRIISSIADGGSIPLSYASSLIKGLKNLIVSAAYTEEKPQKSFRKVSQKAKNYSDSFKLGQTAQGSYIVTIESGSLLEDQHNIFFKDNVAIIEPFSRRVIKRIHKSMLQIESLNPEKDNFQDLIENGYSEGINANICDALLSLYDEKVAVKLESKIKYSRVIENEEELPNFITLNSSDYYTIKRIAEALRAERLEDINIEGYIAKLSSDSELSHGIISIVTTYENKKHTIKVSLDEMDYKNACDAHKNKNQVEIIGIIDRSGKIWEVIDLKEFKILL